MPNKFKVILNLSNKSIYLKVIWQLGFLSCQQLKKLNEWIKKYRETYKLKPLYWDRSWSEFPGRYPYISIIILY